MFIYPVRYSTSTSVVESPGFELGIQNGAFTTSATSVDSLFDVEDIEKGLSSLKLNKASGIDGLTKESISYCHLAVLVHLKLLFNTMSTQLCT